MKKNKILVLISAIVSIYAILGFIALPKILKPKIEQAISENITQKASLGKIEFNPFLLKFTAHNLKIFDKKETTISIEKLLVDFSILKSIDELHISFKDLQLVNPYINIIEYEDGSLNLQKLAIEKKETKKIDVNKNEKKSDIKFQIYRTILDNAKIKFTKYIANKEPYSLNIDKLNYTFYDMGTYKNTLASHSLKILINQHSELIIKGGVRLDPFQMNGNVELKNFKPKDFLTYKKDILNFDLNDDAYLNLQFGYKIDTSKSLNIELNNAHLNLRNLDIKQNEESILSLKHLDIENLNLNYPQNLVNIDTILLDNLNTKIINDKNNQLNLANLIKSDEKNTNTENTQEQVKKEDKKVQEADKNNKEALEEIVDSKKDSKKDDIVQKTANPWKVVLKEFNIKNSNITFNDLANSLFVNTNNINLDLSNFNLNGNDFSLERVALSKPTIIVDDKKNKLNIINNELEFILNNLTSKNSNILLEKIELKNKSLVFKDLKNRLNITTNNIVTNLDSLSKEDDILNIKALTLNTAQIDFKDLKNQLNILTSKIDVNLNSLEQNKDILSIKNVNLINPKISFKDNKNKLHIFTKKTNIGISNIKKEKENISISAVNLKNPSILVRDYKNSLKIITNSLSLNANSINLNGANVKVKKVKLRTPTVKFNNLDTKLDVTTKNINVIATNTSLIKENLKIGILSLTKPSIYLVDNKNDTSIVAKKISLKINNISKYKNSLKISKINLLEPDLVFKDNKSKINVVAKNVHLNVQKISHKNNKLKIVRSSINKPYISVTLGKKPKAEKVDVPNTKIVEKDKEEKKVEPIKTAKKQKKKGTFEFDIGPLKIKDMKMTFEDKNLPIAFKTDITKLNGEFSRLSSNSTKPTKLELEGAVDEYGYTKITGTVDINDIKLLTNTNLLFKNIAIKNFTPYSDKFIGREIESGKLNLELKYNIKKSDLNAQNSIVISNIKLGKNVDSPDAVNLPLELAIALLEDADGVINLNLPISGNVDDPQFSIAPIVWKVFTNLIVKAITSPFRLLASVFGFSEEDIKSLEFEFGKDKIIASEKESLDKIAKILSKKPKLAIKIKPSYHIQKDKTALQDIKFEKDLMKKMEKVLEGDEYQEALEDLYEDIDGVKKLDEVEKSFTKIDKDKKETFKQEEYVEYLRNFLSKKQKVSEKELVLLAKKRVQNISKYLVDVKKVKAEAIIIEEDIIKLDKKDDKWAIFDLDVSVKK
jgi:hypothetical protein